MSDIEKYENLVIGSGGAGKFVAWTMSEAGRRPPWLNAEHSAARAQRCLSSQQEHHLLCQGHLTRQARRGIRSQNRVAERRHADCSATKAADGRRAP